MPWLRTQRLQHTITMYFQSSDTSHRFGFLGVSNSMPRFLRKRSRGQARLTHSLTPGQLTLRAFQLVVFKGQRRSVSTTFRSLRQTMQPIHTQAAGLNPTRSHLPISNYVSLHTYITCIWYTSHPETKATETKSQAGTQTAQTINPKPSKRSLSSSGFYQCSYNLIALHMDMMSGGVSL